MSDRLSRFAVLHPIGDLTLVHSTATGASVVLAREVLAELGSGGTVERSTASELRRLGIVVPADADERASLLLRFDSAAFSVKSLNPIVCLTGDCNVRCVYCYEEGAQRGAMEQGTLRATMDWICRNAASGGFEHVHLTLFGGEPLLEMNLVEELCSTLAERLTSLKKTISFYVSTNGTLLTRDVARRLIAVGVRGGQVSVDGVAKLHDERRPYLTGEGTHDVILRNIVDVADIFDVCVKVNFDRHSCEHFEDLLDELEQAGLREIVTMKLEAVAPTRCSTDDSSHHCAVHAFDSRGADLARTYADLIDAAAKRGFQVSRDTGHSSPCMFTAQHQVAIGQSGDLYKCVSSVGIPEFIVGSVFDEEYGPRYSSCMAARYVALSCLDSTDCPYVPICAGGCQYEAFVTQGRYGKKLCRRQFHEAQIRGLLIMRARAAGLKVSE